MGKQNEESGTKKVRGARKGVEKKAGVTMGKRTDLMFPVGKVQRLLRRDRSNVRIGRGAGIVLTAAMEYLTSEILELAGSLAEEAGKKRIVPRHLALALAQDEELSRMLGSSVIHEGGVRPNIHPALFPAKDGKKKASGDDAQRPQGTQEL